jgi:hypothetical protein
MLTPSGRRKAVITVETQDDGDLTIGVEFDPPAERDNPTLCEALACIAIKAMVEAGKELAAAESANGAEGVNKKAESDV